MPKDYTKRTPRHYEDKEGNVTMPAMPYSERDDVHTDALRSRIKKARFKRLKRVLQAALKKRLKKKVKD